jgi:hypothetical protein
MGPSGGVSIYSNAVCLRAGGKAHLQDVHILRSCITLVGSNVYFGNEMKR